MPALAAGIVRDVAEDFLLLARTVADAESVEWEVSKTPKLAEETTRAGGGHGDPTGATATDAPRLALRARADASRELLGFAREALRQSREKLTAELQSYHGEHW